MPKLNLTTVSVEHKEVVPPPFQLSPQQTQVIDFATKGRGNGLLIAAAGAAKTTTLVELCKHIRGSKVFVAFNKKIADEIGVKLLKAGVDSQSVRAATFHSFGLQAWKRVAPNVQVKDTKMYDLMEVLSVPRHVRAFSKALVSLAKQSAFGAPGQPTNDDWLAYEDIVEHFDLSDKLYADDFQPDDESEAIALGIEWAQKLLRESDTQDTRLIDFDDMLRTPLFRHATFWKNDWVLIDEAQDTNPARRAMAKEMLRSDGRLIAVGDPRQAIYGFTGASADALDLIKDEFDCTELKLSVTFRCARNIVAYSHKWVPEDHIEAAPNAPEGSVSYMGDIEFRKIVPQKEDAILCRNTKPLIQLALDYIRRKIPAHVEGRDIGQSLLSLCKKWKRPQTIGQLADTLVEWKGAETLRLMEKGQDAKIAALHDRVDSILVIMESLHDDDPIYKLEAAISGLFQDTEGKPVQSITLSTVHKSKGREWDRVYLYGRNVYMPSPFARQLWQIEQEHNLIYVAVTRAKRELIEVERAAP